MTIKHFRPASGVYVFVEQGLKASQHQHPAVEILLVQKGQLDIVVNGQAHLNIKGCIIPPNVVHSVQGQNALCEIWILEKSPEAIAALDLMPSDFSGKEIALLSESELLYFDDALLTQFQSLPTLSITSDQRVNACISYIKENLRNAALNRDLLSAKVHLSPSRLSHLFKTQTGTTLQNYIIWERLKCAISCSLNQEINLLNAAYQAGFYDAAHFSRAFQKMFGVNPSSAYNSSILQI